MSSIVIHAQNLGKRYRIGQRERYLALRDVLARAASAPVRLFKAQKPSPSNGDRTHIWALKDVSFEVRQGEVMGIIGCNGAGKTTLLKILARVTYPTEGFAEVRGRMGSLLEVGTGFHPELTGRENVFLSGAILGMRKFEIEREFDEIVAFAEVERFIDTPVKHYSVGMRMRLAFAVAAHMEPEILLVDEVLSVGDLTFQKKCLGKMGKVAEGGRTILFVSHQMNQIRRLCERVLWIDAGGIRADGPAKLLVNEYEAACLMQEELSPPEARASIAVRSWQVEASGTNVLDLDQNSHGVVVRIEAQVTRPVRKGKYFVGLRDAKNNMVWSHLCSDLRLDPGPVSFIQEFPFLPLAPGVYTWDVRVNDGDIWSDFILTPEFSIVSRTDSDVYGHLKGVMNLPFELRLVTDCADGERLNGLIPSSEGNG
jgi:ABC-type polysaccharide/polyol phosphate transport system ATPase subunit